MIRSLLRGLVAALVLAVLVVGVPALLIAVAGWPLPNAVPSVEEIGEALGRTGVATTTIIKAVAVVVWLGWLQLVLAVVAEVRAAWRHRAGRRHLWVPGIRWATHALVGTLVTVLHLGGMRPLGAAVPTPPLAAAMVATGAAVAPAARPAVREAAPPHPVWIVRPRDTWWGIAEQVLGRGDRWREIARLNADREVAPGVRLEGRTDVLRPGWRLLLPAGAEVTVLPTPVGSPAAPVTRVASCATPTRPSAPATGSRPSRTSVRPGQSPSPSWSASSPPSTGRSRPPRALPVAAATQITVRRGDTLSTIAARVYGDAGQWRRIWEANRGRHFGQRVFDDPNLIIAGWELRIPAPPSPPSVLPAAVPTVPSVELPPAVASPPTDPPPANSPPEQPSTTVTSPPPTAGPAPSAPATTPTVAPPPAPPAAGPVAPEVAPSPPPSLSPSTTVAAAPDTDGLVDVGASNAADDGDAALSSWTIGTGLAGAMLLATGVTGLVASRRRRRLEQAGRDDAPAAPDPELAPVERAARRGSDAAALARLDVALRALAAEARDAVDDGPRPVAVRLDADGALHVHLAHPAPAVSPWRSVDGGAVWTLPADVGLQALARAAAGLPSPCPALVHLGAGDDGDLFVDLEAAGVIAIDASPAAWRFVARAVVASLAVTPLADRVHVIAAGLDCYGFADELRVQSVADAGAAVELASGLAAPVQRALVPPGPCSTFQLRARRPDELWEPVVVVAAGSATESADLQALRSLAGEGGHGIAVLTDAPLPEATWRLRVDADGWHVEPLGEHLRPVGLAADDLADLGALLTDAAAPLVPAAPLPPPAPRATVAPFAERPWELLVRVLGPVEVVDRQGRAATFERAKALELVVWLAQHRVHPTRSGARTALWETEVRDATFANVVSDARRSLARFAASSDGEEWIGRTYAEDLPLHPAVTTDADLLAARLEHASGLPAEDAIAVATLRAGLELVRDLPYAGTSFVWPDELALPSHLTLLVVKAAVAMAERCLELDDVDGVFWATSQGMKALPAHEELVCLRLRAHAAQGNLAGVRADYESYERAVMADPWGDSTPSPKVVALRTELLRVAARLTAVGPSPARPEAAGNNGSNGSNGSKG